MRSVRTTFGGIMAVALVLAQVLQAAPLRDCPHHDHGFASPTAAPPATGPQADHAGHADHAAGHGDSPSHGNSSHDDPSHDGPCDCLGDCQAPPAARVPSRAAELVPVPTPSRRSVEMAPVEAGRRPAAVPFALPFCRPPPV